MTHWITRAAVPCAFLLAGTFAPVVSGHAVAAAAEADASPRVRAHAQALYAQVQNHPTARVNVAASVAALPAALEPELRAYLAESGLSTATGVLARTDVAYRSAAAVRIATSSTGRQSLIELIGHGRDRRPMVLRAVARAVAMSANASERAALFAAVGGVSHDEQAALLMGIAGKRETDVRDYLAKQSVAPGSPVALTAALEALGEYGAKPYWDAAAGAAERNRVAELLFAQLTRAAQNEDAKAAFIKSMLRIDSANQTELRARALAQTGAAHTLAEEWNALANRMRSY